MKQTALTTTTNPAEIARINDAMTSAGKAANKAAQRGAFIRAVEGKADNTRARKIADLALFETFLNSLENITDGISKPHFDPPVKGLYSNPETWRGVTFGLVEAFKAWMIKQGYAVASVNARLSTVRTHAAIAAQAGALDESEARMIATVKGYSRKESKHVDAQRSAAGIETRRTLRADGSKATSKKAQAVEVGDDIAAQLVNGQPNTATGRRDALLMALLLEHGLRVSEVAILTVASFDMKRNTFTFYRPKVDKVQTHTMTPNTRKAAAAYLKYDAPAVGVLWRKVGKKGSAKLSGQLSETSATRALNKRVELLGRRVGIDGLSPHDCRHYWATFEARKGTPLQILKAAGGWNSLAMPDRYINAAAIANTGTARITE